MYYQEFRVSYEVIAAVICFILVWFMVKPYRFTKKGRYAGLPLAFGFLGASYLFSALTYALPSFINLDMLWFQLIARTFAFVFLSATYFFSKKVSEKSQFLWNITFSGIVVAIVMLVIAILFLPQLNFENYRVASSYVRVFIVISLVYVIIHTLRNHTAKPDSTILTPLGYILLAISQYSLIIWATDVSMIAFWVALGLRLGALAIFLFVTYVTFYGSRLKGQLR
jgi:hypothetical protein